MKKIITPIINGALLIPLTAIAVAFEFVARRYGILPEWEGHVDTPLIILGCCLILVIGIPFYWLTHFLIQRFEKLKNPTIIDHLRQSLFFYLIIIYSASTWLVRGYHGGEEDGYLLLWSGYSLVAMVINYIFLFVSSQAGET